MAAMALFAEKGYASTSIADILKHADANSGSLYDFFPAKQDLLLAVRDCLDAAGERLPDDVDRDALARFVLTTMEGGVMQARTHRSLAAFDASVSQLRRYFAFLTEQPRGRRSMG